MKCFSVKKQYNHYKKRSLHATKHPRVRLHRKETSNI